MGIRLQGPTIHATAKRISAILAHERFFYFLVGLFVVQALWLAFTARYPMAFDEDFHFGLIQYHAQQLLPFFTAQPANADQYGAVVRDPSYFYHFLMSIPYRLVSHFTGDQVIQVISLRLINIAMASCSFVLFRRLLLQLGASRPLTHASLLLFTLVPIVPFLAAQINYDNLFILLTVSSLLESFIWFKNLSYGTISAGRSLLLLTLFALVSIVKYAFLPIALAISTVMIWQLIKTRGQYMELRKSFVASFHSLAWWQAAAAIFVLLVSVGLFSERYVVNVISFHSPSPDCAAILSVRTCIHYSPWARDYFLVQNKVPTHPITSLAYIWQWPFGIWLRSFFAINDAYWVGWPLPLPGATVIVVGIAGLYLFLRYRKQILAGNLNRQIILLAFVAYVSALVAQTFQSYMKTGEPVAINGRYLLPFLPAIIVLAGLSFSELWRRRTSVKSFAVVAVALLFLQGGGVLTFILRSDDTWDWPSDAIVAVNRTVREKLKTVVVGASQ